MGRREVVGESGGALALCVAARAGVLVRTSQLALLLGTSAGHPFRLRCGQSTASSAGRQPKARARQALSNADARNRKRWPLILRNTVTRRRVERHATARTPFAQPPRAWSRPFFSLNARMSFFTCSICSFLLPLMTLSARSFWFAAMNCGERAGEDTRVR